VAELGPAQKRTATDMKPAVGHGCVRVCARVGGEACTKQPKEGAPLSCSRVREANVHGGTVSRGATTWRGPTQGEKDQRPGLDLSG
jgi:hypothetical protein